MLFFFCLFPSAQLCIYEEVTRWIGSSQLVYDAKDIGFFFHLLVDELPQEVLGGVVLLFVGDIGEQVDELGYMPFMLVGIFKDFQCSLPALRHHINLVDFWRGTSPLEVAVFCAFSQISP